MMSLKNTVFLLSISAFAIQVNAQSVKSDSVVMGPGYANQIYYDLNTGTKTSAPVANWDIAHTSDVRDNCIRVNHKNGIQVFYYPKADKSGWGTFDTTGWKTWNRYYNDDHMHAKGALNYQSNPPFGIGWGTYNTSSHETIGDSLYLLAWFDGSKYVKFIKFQPIKQTVTANLIFRFANLDGSSEVQDTIYQADANNQNYKYYSFNQTQPIREPAKGSWDISFNNYWSKDESYFVMGVESNRGTKAVKISGPAWSSVLADSANLMSTYMPSVSDDLTAIGHKWKYFSNSQFKWFLADTQSFIVKSVRGMDSLYWLIHFTDFGGSGTGKVVFSKMLLGKTNSVNRPVEGKLSVFPVPATDELFVILENNFNSATATLTDLNGRIVAEKAMNKGDLQAARIDISNLPAGNYVLSVTGTSTRLSRLIQIK